MQRIDHSMAARPQPLFRGTSVNRWLALSLILLLCLGAGIFGAIATHQSLVDWYPTLRKPSWNPPNWIFGPVWTILYLMMGIAAWLVWRSKGRAYQTALLLFTVQLTLNGIWSPLFFGLRNPLLALIDIAALWLMIGATAIAFYRSSRTAALLMMPYLAWVSYASTLNFEIWMLN